MPDNIKKNPAFDNALPCSSDKAKTLEKPYSTEWMLLHCLGFGTCWGWVHVAFFSTVLGGVIPESLSLSVWILNVLSNGLAMVALGLLFAFRSSYSLRGLDPLFSIFTILGTIGLSFGQSSSEIWAYAAAVLSGFGTAGLLLLWAEAYRDIPPTFAKQKNHPRLRSYGCFVLPAYLHAPSIIRHHCHYALASDFSCFSTPNPLHES